MMVISFLGTWVPILEGNFFSFSFNFLLGMHWFECVCWVHCVITVE